MALILLACFIAVPILEIAILIEVGSEIGVWQTIGLVILTAIVGTALLRQQGIATLRRAQQSLDRNQFPVAEAADGLCLFLAGAFLLTPGFFTDTIGFMLLIPPLRRLMMMGAIRFLQARGTIDIRTGGPGGRHGGGRQGGAGPTIDGDWHEVDSGRPGPPRRGPNSNGTNGDKDDPRRIGN